MLFRSVMHADEVNTGLSADLKKDVFHYHLHVVYIPVVGKEVKWTKRCKDLALVGTVKDVIQQVSHSKKWPKFKDDKGDWVNSYSLLQDRFFEGMKEAGFKDFERGDYKSTRQHLSDMEYKIKKDAERIEWLGQTIEDKTAATDELDGKIEKRSLKLKSLDKKIDDRVNGVGVMFGEFQAMATPTRFGEKVTLSKKDWGKVLNAAEQGIVAKSRISDLKNKSERTERDRDNYRNRFEELYEKTKWFLKALERFPQKVTEFIRELISQPKKAHQEQQTPSREKNKGYER